MENQLVIALWIIAIAVSFIPMPLMFKIIGVILSIILIAIYIVIAKRDNQLSTTSLIINLLIIGWDLAVLYGLLTAR